MTFPGRKTWRILAGCLVLFLAAGLAAPYLNADRFGARIRAALENSIGRKVKIGNVRFSFFQGPGFFVDNVEIEDDPAFGIEPFAWVGSIEARIRLRSLWNRKLEWASLRLDEPIVNLVKVNPEGHWNFEPLLNPSLIQTLPRISVRQGRINFKFGDTKSVFYVTAADVDATAPTPGESDWDLKFSGEPARTDRAATGLGSFIGKGRWSRASAGADRVKLDLELEKSALSEISALVTGRDVGIHGTVSSRFRLAGPVNNIQISGSLQLQELHRWDQMPMKGDGWPLDFRGRLDLIGQKFEIESDGKGLLPIGIRYRAWDYLSRPHWGAGFSWNKFPAEPLVAIARHMGAPLPEQLKLDGTLDGAVSWSEREKFQGQVVFHDAALTLPDSSAMRFERAQILFEGDRIHLLPATVHAEDSDRGKGSEAQLEAEFIPGAQRLGVTISSESMSVNEMRSHAVHFPAPFLVALSSGLWKGRLHYERSAETEEGWSGQIQLTQAEVPIPGLAEPLRVDSASARLEGARLTVDKLRARIGEVQVEGDYRYEPTSLRPHRLRLNIPKIDSVELERILIPTLARTEGFIARTLGIGRTPLPGWLADRRMEGSFQIGAFACGDIIVNDLRSRIRWNAAQVELNDVRGQVENGSLRGAVSVDLRARKPVYHANFQLASMDFKGGKVNAEGFLDTTGTGGDVLAELRSEGSFAAHNLELAPLNHSKTASGCYRLEWARRIARLRLTELQLTVGSDLFIGRGSTEDDGRLLLQLSSGDKQLRVTGTLAQLRFE